MSTKPPYVSARQKTYILVAFIYWLWTMFKKLLSVILMVWLLWGSVFAIKNLWTVQRYTQDFAPFTARDIPDMQAVMDYADWLQETGMWIKTWTSIFYTGDNVWIGTNNPQAKLDVVWDKVMFWESNTYSTDPQIYDMAMFGRQNHVEKGSYSMAVWYNNTFSWSSTSSSLVVWRDNITDGGTTDFIAWKSNNSKSAYTNILWNSNNAEWSYTNIFWRWNILWQYSVLATVIWFSNEIAVSAPPWPYWQYIFWWYNTITWGTDEQMIIWWNWEMSWWYNILLNASQDKFYVTWDHKIILNSTGWVWINTANPTRTLEVWWDAMIQTWLVVWEWTLNNVWFVMWNNCVAWWHYSMAVWNTNQALWDHSVSLWRNNISNSHRAITIWKNNSDSNSVSYDSIMIWEANHVSSSSDFAFWYSNIDLWRWNTTVWRSNQINWRNWIAFWYSNFINSQAYWNVTVWYENQAYWYNNTLLWHWLISSWASWAPQQTLLWKFNKKIWWDVVVIWWWTSDSDRRNAITITWKRIWIWTDNPNRALETSWITRSSSFEIVWVLPAESRHNTFDEDFWWIAVWSKNYVEWYWVAIWNKNYLYDWPNKVEWLVIWERNIMTWNKSFIQWFSNKLSVEVSQWTVIGTSNIWSWNDLFIAWAQNEINWNWIISIWQYLTWTYDTEIILWEYNVDVDNASLIVWAWDSWTRKNAMVVEDWWQIWIWTDTPDTQLQVNWNIRPEVDWQNLGKDSSSLRWDANLRNVNFVSMYWTTNGRFKLPTSTSDPIFPTDWMMYYNTSTDKLRLRANWAWININ